MSSTLRVASTGTRGRKATSSGDPGLRVRTLAQDPATPFAFAGIADAYASLSERLPGPVRGDAQGEGRRHEGSAARRDARHAHVSLATSSSIRGPRLGSRAARGPACSGAEPELGGRARPPPAAISLSSGARRRARPRLRAPWRSIPCPSCSPPTPAGAGSRRAITTTRSSSLAVEIEPGFGFAHESMAIASFRSTCAPRP